MDNIKSEYRITPALSVTDLPSKRCVVTITKAALVQEVYLKHDLNKAQATEAVENFLEIIKGKLGSGKDVLISGFGKFNIKQKKARQGRNPQTGEQLTLEARKVVTFTPSGILKEKINI